MKRRDSNDWNIGYVPASAKDGDNVALIFDELIAKAGVDVNVDSNKAHNAFKREVGMPAMSCRAIS